MNSTSDPAGPFPEEYWAGYLDNELDPADRQRMETWLAAHPEAAAELEAHQRLARLWRCTPPAQPSEAAWTMTLGRIETAVARRKRSRLIGLWLALAGTAAAAILMANLGRFRPPAPGLLENPEEPFPVVSVDDVDILSMDGADIAAFPVGQPPVEGPLELATASDVTVKSVQPDSDGMLPAVHMPPQGSSASPMIVAPVGGEAKEPDSSL